ncbi:MAG: hypothetical protein ABIP39_10400 [Polyangiaceae bacterium]
MSSASWIDWWFRDRATGRIVIAQFPNAPLGVWLGATLLHSFLSKLAHADVLRWIACGALLAWGLDELLRGANPFRRVVGAIAVGYEIWVIAIALH